MPIGPDFDVKDRVKQATDLVDLVGGYMNLRRQGKSLVGLCPFHADTKPSFLVNPARQRWDCWVCDLHGDAFDFVMKKESVDFRGALEILAQKAGIELRQHSGPKAKPGDPNHKPTLYEAMKWVEEQYHHCLLSSNEAIPIRAYLDERGITQESIRRFRIGFASLAWSWLVDRVQKTNFTPQILEASGLVTMNQRGTWYERFRGRVLFPIRDTQDRPIALGGRVVPGIYGTEEEPKGKYVNSPETKLFSKSDNLYALDLARHEIQDSKSLTIVEGYTDVVAAWQSGVTNVVAALGTALNERHLRLIKRFAEKITLVLDGDTAGQRRTNEVLDLFVTGDVDLRILSLPEGTDPFDFCMTHGGPAFQELVDAAPDAIAHRIQTETAGIDILNQTHAANQALDNILKTLAAMPVSSIASSAARQLRQQQLFTRLARQFNIDAESIKRRVTEIRNSNRPRRYSSAPENETPQVPAPHIHSMAGKEKELLQILILHPQLLDEAIENVAVTQFTNEPLKAIYQLMGEFFHDGSEVAFDNLILEVTDPYLRNLLSQLHEDAICKVETTQADSTMIALDIKTQFDSVLASFADAELQQQHRAKLSALKDNNLSKEDEATALEELFKQARQRHGL